MFTFSTVTLGIAILLTVITVIIIIIDLNGYPKYRHHSLVTKSFILSLVVLVVSWVGFFIELLTIHR